MAIVVFRKHYYYTFDLFIYFFEREREDRKHACDDTF